MQKYFLWDTKDYCYWGFAPQVPHGIISHGNISWGHLIGGLLLELPMTSLIVEFFVWAGWTFRLVSQDMKGISIHRRYALHSPNQNYYCMSNSIGEMPFITPIIKGEYVYFFTGLE